MARQRVMTPAELLLERARQMREVPDLTNQVIACALSHDWFVSHQRPAQAQSGRWSTAIQGSKGFPDLVLVRGATFALRELKRYGKADWKPGQREWGERAVAAGIDWAVWTTLDWLDGTVERWLRTA